MLFMGVYYQSEQEKKFKTACETARKLSKRTPNNEVIELYSLYKQATVGNINVAKPADEFARKKWEAWHSKRGVTVNKAKEQYVAKVKYLSGVYT
ncbi:unnamed protein product [Phyllotreta striolata]|uniref:ACB domain-containing protein n=1 Tax=Phyllotreta striolata TaxID=444603 RepID=A0A9N9U1Q9_PHYSR|nr:unnamed protein product [Phyllotreta striolata]